MKRRWIPLALAGIMTINLLSPMGQLIVKAETNNNEVVVASDEVVASGTCGESSTWKLDDEGLLTISGSGETYDYNLDENYEPGAPWHKYTVKKVVIEEGITAIGEENFYDDRNIKEIVIPDSVTSLSKYAIYLCTNLTDVYIGKGLNSISSGVFDDCNNLTNIEIDSENKNFCTDSKGVIYNKNKTELFKAPPGLSGVYAIPDSVNTICYGAFSDCENMTEVNIPNSVKTIEGSAFLGCVKLTHVTLPNQLEKISDFLFAYCNLISLTIPSSVTFIDMYAFDLNDVLQEVYYGGSKESWNAIEVWRDNEDLLNADFIHYNCNNFESHWMNKESAATCTEPGSSYEYCQCGYTRNSVEKGEALGHEYDDGCITKEPTITTEGVIKYTCLICGSTKEESMPVLEQSDILDSGKCGDNLKWELTKDGKLSISGTGAMYSYASSEDGSEVPWYKYKNSVNKVVFDNGVSSICGAAFEDFSNLTGELELPQSLTSIGAFAFKGCSGLTGKLIIPENVSVIGSKAFEECYGFTGLTLPKKMEAIESAAFRGCIGFRGELVLPEGLNVINTYTFKGCGFTGDLIIPEGVTSIGYGCFEKYRKDIEEENPTYYYCGFDGKLVLPEGLTTIDNQAFIGCSFTGELNLPNSLETIGDSAFLDCSGFTGELIIPPLLKKIGANVFSGCSGISGEVIIPDTVTMIDQGAFNDCNSIDSIYIYNKECELDKNHQGTIPVHVVIYGYPNSTAHTYAESNSQRVFRCIEHVWDSDFTIDIEPSCEKTGEKSIHCSVCTVTKDKEEAKALGHNFINYVSDENATCTEDGTKTAKCDRCDVTDTVTDEKSAKGHDYVTEWSKDETNHWHECSVCGNDGDVASHEYNNTAKCSVCEYEKAHVHSLSLVQAVEQTCEEDGNIAYYVCSGCDVLFEDADGTKVIEDKNSVIIAANGHTFTAYTYDNNATCENDGTKRSKCDYCDEMSVLTDEGSALGHSYGKDGVCTNCGQTDPSVTGKINSEIAFVKTSSTVSYSGESIGLSKDVVDVKKGSGEITFTYYLDEKCTIPTYKSLSIAGSAPCDTGIYYVKATAEADDTFNETTAEGVYILKIRPRRVASVTVSNISSGIKLSWKERTEADGYVILRRAKGTSSDAYKTIATVTGSDTVSYTDKDIKQGNGYIYSIRAYSDAEDGTQVNGLMLKTAKKIIRTKITSITNQNGSMKVKWSKVPGSEGYKVYRKSSGEDTYKLIKTIDGGSVITYTDKSSKAIKNGKASYYYVKACFDEEDNGYNVTTDKKTKYYVSRPTISSLTGSSKSFTVKWNKNSAATAYQIRYSTSSSFDDYETITISDKNTVSKKISDLKKNKKYYVKVRSYKTYKNVKYYSAWSGYKSVKTK